MCIEGKTSLDLKSEIKSVYSDPMLADHRGKLHVYLSNKFCKEFTLLNEEFIKMYKISIDAFVSKLLIGLIKEQLVYTDHSFTLIAEQFAFLSVRELSSFFKSHTGLSLSFFRELR